ncbi:MAG TPA: lipase maturation factor family protein [Tepidisphaeraceae bacterium]
MSPPRPRPALIYDGGCAFCRRWVARWQRITGDAVEYVASREATGRFPQIPRTAFDRSVWLVEPDGRTTEAAEAVFRALALSGRNRGWLWAYEHVPGFAGASNALYRFIAARRTSLDRFDRWLFPEASDPRHEYAITRAILLRALGVIYLIAFVSLWVQVDGLFGSRGIAPIRMTMEFARNQIDSWGPWGIGRCLHLPTLCWWNTSDSFLHALCGGGVAAACLVILGILPLPALIVLWVFYLSLVSVGQPFLGFQWDALLLESGLLAILVAPWSWRVKPGLLLGRRARPSRPSRIGVFLLRWLVFRLMFLSGLVKWIADNPPAWRDLTAMRYHYETQPLPTWTSWYAFQLPAWFQSCSTAGVLVIEGLIPFLFFFPRRARLFACAATAFLQILILATGNYGFFNLLALVLCIPLLDDDVFMRLRRRRKAVPNEPEPHGSAVGLWGRAIRGAVLLPVAVAIVVLSIVAGLIQIGQIQSVPAPLLRAYLTVLPFESINGYGLFQDMTTRRPEVIVEGSDDGTRWLEYAFKYKPGDVYRRPGFCTPHMPRLDWQLWFAALGLYDSRQADPWVWNFLERLREGDPAVLALMARNPFPDHPPKYVRIALYDYHFTTPAQRRATGAWWVRTRIDEPPVAVGPPGQ